MDKDDVVHTNNGILFSRKNEMGNQVTKRHGGTLNASYYVNEANLKRLHTVQLQIDILENAKLWRQ